MDAQSINTGSLAAATLTVTGSASIGGDLSVGGNLTVKGLTTVADIMVGGHIISRGNAPQLSVGVAAGTSGQNQPAPAATVDGTDTAGTVTVNTGTAVADSGILAEVTFASGYPSGTSYKVALTPTSGTALNIRVYVQKTANGFQIVTPDKPAPGTSYSFDYIVIGAQQVAAGN